MIGMILKGIGLFVLLGVLAMCVGLCSSVPSTQSYKDKAQAQKAAIANEPLTEKGKKIKAKHQDWSNDVCNTIAEKKIRVGMTDAQVRASWGKPYKINSTVNTYGTSEQWVMSDGGGSDYVYFDNGVMTSLQQSK